MADKHYYRILPIDCKKAFKYCQFPLCKSQRAKYLTSFLIFYVLGTVFYVRQYIFNERDLSLKFCENHVEHVIIEERSNVDRILYQYLPDQPTETEEGDKFIVAHDHIFLYSAYLDDRRPPAELKTRYYVKIVGIVLRGWYEKYLPDPKCHLKFQNDVVVNETAVLVYIPEGHASCYSAAFLFCPISRSLIPKQVAITADKSSRPRWLPVESLLKKPITNGQIAVCVRPFYGEDFSIIQLAEFISQHHLQGISHFQFYNVSAPTQVRAFLDLLRRNMSFDISLLQWNVPLKRYLVHEWGQLAFIQDCILRWQTRTEYVAVLDLDEILMPQMSSETLPDVLKELKVRNPDASAFILPSVMFCQEYLPTAHMNVSELMPFVSLYGDKRQATAWPHRIRSKYVVRPGRVLITGIHFVWESLDYFWPVNVPPDLISLYHYRTCCNMDQPWFFGLMAFNVFSDAVRMDTKATDMARAITNSPIYRLLRNLLQIS